MEGPSGNSGDKRSESGQERATDQYSPENTKVLTKAKNFLKLDFLESLEIKHRCPELNKGLKSCKDLALFWPVVSHDLRCHDV